MTKKEDPNEIVHAQVKPGGTVVFEDKAYGDRGTLQVRRGDLNQLHGPYDIVSPDEVPDVARR